MLCIILSSPLLDNKYYGHIVWTLYLGRTAHSLLENSELCCGMFSIVFQSVFHSDECCPLMLHFVQASPGPGPGVDQGESLVSCHWRNKIYHGLFDTHFVVTKRIVTLYRIRYLHYPAQHYLNAQFSEHLPTLMWRGCAENLFII